MRIGLAAIALVLAGCWGPDCAEPTIGLRFVHINGQPVEASKLVLVADHPGITVGTIVCPQTKDTVQACPAWVVGLLRAPDAKDGSFSLKGTLTSLAGKEIPVVVPMSVTDAAKACCSCGNVFAPGASTVTVAD